MESLRVAHFKSPYLPLSQAFIYDLLRVQKQGVHFLFTDRVQNLSDFPWRPIILFKDYRSLLHLFNGQRLKVIHAHYGQNGIKALRLKRSTGLPLITSFHGEDITARPAQDPHYRELLSELFAEGDLFIVADHHLKEMAMHWGCPEAKLRLLPASVDLEQFRYRPHVYDTTGPLSILSVGRLVEKKGMDTLIEAVRCVNEAGSATDLTIIGDGELKEALEAQIQRAGLSGRVKLVGSKSRDQVIQALQNADLFVLASRTAISGDQDGQPLAVVEAMAIGVPVLSTFHAGIPELVHDRVSGCLVPPGDAGALARRILEYQQSPDLWRPYLGAARKTVERHHDLREQVNRLYRLYEELAMNKGG
ncbi:MAG: glycosyltransferase [Bacillota bacterium]